MVAVDSPASGAAQALAIGSRRNPVPWALAAAGALGASLAVRMVLVPPSAGGMPAVVMLVLLSSGAWLAAWLLGWPRAACVAVLVTGVLINLAALPPRPGPEFDERIAFYRTDQPITASVRVNGALHAPALTLLVEPIWQGTQAPFGLAGEVAGTMAEWTCQYQRGVQRLALPLPPDAVAISGDVNVRLHLTGSPTREADYLLVYASARRPGLLISMTDDVELEPGVTRCALR